MTYEEALEYIAALEPRGWRLGLDRMEEFVRRASLSDAIGPDAPSFIHVAGTNGKGSVTAYLQSILSESGYRTGAFFSPFVVDPRERVQFGREMIPKQDLARLTQQLIPPAESLALTDLGGITEFEFKTAIGFAFWKERRCEWVALEVGLGGRLDATNVVTPKASVIVSVGHDHMNVLGHSLSQIAHEKAGIIKRGVPVIVGEMPREALEVVESESESLGAQLWRWGAEVVLEGSSVHTPLRTHPGLHPGLAGAPQQHNMALSVAAVDAAGAFLDEEAVRRGVASAWLPGRFQIIDGPPLFVLDGAHNPEAAESLRRSLVQRFGAGAKFVLVTNMVAGHEPADFYSVLCPLIHSAHVVPIDFRRALPVDKTGGSLRDLDLETETHATVEGGIEAAKSTGLPILVTGSFYLVGEVSRLISDPSYR